MGHPSTLGSMVNIYGRIGSTANAQVDLGLDVTGVVFTPETVTFYERDQQGATSLYFNQVVDGRERHERTIVVSVAKQGFCMRCRESVDHRNVTDVMFRNGRAASKGECVKCGTLVFRTGEGATELQTRLQADMQAAA